MCPRGKSMLSQIFLKSKQFVRTTKYDFVFKEMRPFAYEGNRAVHVHNNNYLKMVLTINLLL